MQNKNKIGWLARKWIVPPGLRRTMEAFDVRCEMILEKYKKNRTRPMIIHGPTGVGKSMFTEYFIHKFSTIKTDFNVVFINCAAIPSELLESELFGVVKGAHSKADVSREGYFEKVGDGVIVLEELGELPKHLQAKLLVAIETKTFARLGSTVELKFKAQIIATTNADMDSFRKDLWYRFEIFSVPAIYERREDVLFYIEHFDEHLIKLLTKGAVLSALSYNWPGNVREIERVCIAIRSNLMLADKYSISLESCSGNESPRLLRQIMHTVMQCDSRVSDFKFDKAQDVANEMLRRGINVLTLDEALQDSYLSFDCYNPLFVDSARDHNIYTNTEEIEFTNGTIKFVDNLKYSFAAFGLSKFCRMFLQNDDCNMDILTMSSISSNEEIKKPGMRDKVFSCNESRSAHNKSVTTKSLKNKSSFFKKYDFISANRTPLYMDIKHLSDNDKSAVIEAFKYTTNIYNIALDDLLDVYKLWEKNKNNGILCSHLGFNVENDDIFDEVPMQSIAIDDLKALYYETVCSTIGTKRGYKKKLAEISKRSGGRITQEFKEFGLNEKFSQLNYKPRKRLVVLK